MTPAQRLLATRRIALAQLEQQFRAELGPALDTSPTLRTRQELAYARRLYLLAEVRAAKLRSAGDR